MANSTGNGMAISISILEILDRFASQLAEAAAANL